MARWYRLTWRRGDVSHVVYGQGNTRRSAARHSTRRLRDEHPDLGDLKEWSWTAEYDREGPP